MSFILSQLVFQPPKFSKEYEPEVPIFLTSKKTKKKIPAYYLKSKILEEKRTIIYSHGNACDIAQCYDFVKLLNEKLKVNVLHYEYYGYGRIMNETPSEEGVFDCADTALDFLTNQEKLNIEDIILFGTSLGSAPAVYLASKYNKIKALILESPFTSIVRTRTNLSIASIFDMFLNYSRIGKVEATVLIFHGKEDVVVPVEHGVELFNSCKNKYELVLIDNAGHNNMREKHGYRNYLLKLRDFICAVCPKECAPNPSTSHAGPNSNVISSSPSPSTTTSTTTTSITTNQEK